MMDNFVKATIQYSPISEPKNPFMLECFTIRTIQIIYIDDLIRIKVLPGNQDIQETMINVVALICIMVLPTNQDYKLNSKYLLRICRILVYELGYGRTCVVSWIGYE
jgi:hypothetical protein